MPGRKGPRRAWAVLLAAVAGLALAACADAAPSGGLRGARLEVVAVWTGAEQRRFEPVLRAFEAATGVSVAYRPAGHDVADELDARLAGGHPPDVAVLPQPGLLRRYVAAGRLVPLDRATSERVTASYPLPWRELASFDGRLYGVWFKAADKSLIWYDVGAFERAGVVPPRDVDGLLAVARTLTVSGVPAFAVAGRDGWTLTDWFENLYLRLAGPRRYDALTAHRIAWTDPSVKETLRLLARILAPDLVAGGTAGALRTDFEQSVAQAFADPPGAAMVCEGDFVAGLVDARAAGRVGVDVDVFPFPTLPGAGPGVVGGGDVAVLMRPSPAGAALLRYLATPAAAAIWAARGGFVSPNVDVDLLVYPDETTRSIARALLDAGEAFRFDLSDLQPAVFGASERRGLRRELRDFLAHRDVDATARRLEAQARSAFAGGGR